MSTVPTIYSFLPISEEIKKEQVKKILKANDKELQKALVQAALINFQFPFSTSSESSHLNLQKKIRTLQEAYEANSDQEVKGHLEKAIQSLVSPNFIKDFKKFSSKSNAQEWNSGFIIHLSRQLEIKVPSEPVVEAAISEGKVYWRIMKGGEEIFNRAEKKEHDFDFNKAQCWRMQWKQFRCFKDSGKRSGSVAITKNLFKKEFDQEFGDFNKVWNELRNKGVLTSKNRLSHGWRALCMKKIELKSLKKIDGYKKLEEIFLKIINDESNAEKIEIKSCNFQETIFRLERTPKIWHRTGSVTNSCTPEGVLKLWDVGSYSELSARKQSTQDSKQLERDHIPSYSTLERESKRLKKLNALLAESIENLETKNTTLKEKRKQLEKKEKNKKDVSTRSKSKIDPLQQETEELEDEVEKYNKEISLYKKQIEAEKNDINANGWTIAIPDDLHKQGVTYLLSPKKQKKIKENPFLLDVRRYLEILNQRKEDFGLNMDDFLKALGAFRYLYRCQVKNAEKINSFYRTSDISIHFFKDKNVLSEIDSLFTTSIRFFFDKTEGIKIEENEGKKEIEEDT